MFKLFPIGRMRQCSTPQPKADMASKQKDLARGSRRTSGTCEAGGFQGAPGLKEECEDGDEKAATRNKMGGMK